MNVTPLDAWRSRVAESPIERLFRESAALLWPGTPELRQAHPVRTDAGLKVIDFAVPELKLAVELESWAWHSGLGPDKVTADRQRERALERAGWRVVSFTGKEVTASAARCVRETLKIAGLEEARPEKRDRDDWPEILDYQDRLWQCRKLCIRAGIMEHPRRDEYRYVPLILFDAFGFWDTYPARYDYTSCVDDLVFPDSDCEHQTVDGSNASYLTCLPCWTCKDCWVQFPYLGGEQAWLADLRSCPR